jgi:alkylhydroperoxidase family enzyme
VWAWRPDVFASYVSARGGLVEAASLSERDLAVLVTSAASQRGDSYCSLAWGTRLSRLTDEHTAAGVISGESPDALSPREAALAGWARQVVRDPNATTAEDVESLRAAGLDDRAIFEATVFIALRLAFSTVNDALGASPDKELVDKVPAAVREAVTYGRRPMTAPSA